MFLYVRFFYPVSSKSFTFDCASQLVVREEKFNFLIKLIYQVKETKFFFLSQNNETYLMEISNLGCDEKEDITLFFNYDEIRYRILRHNYSLEKNLSEDSLFTLFSNDELIFFNYNQILKVSFLDSVEELSELCSLKPENKFKIIFHDRIYIKSEESLLVIYKDLTCEILQYDKKVREIKRIDKFILMVEDDYMNMRYSVIGNVLIGYSESVLNFFDLNMSRIQPGEKYVDRVIELRNIFGRTSKKLFFSNYFIENFPDECKEYMKYIKNETMKIAKDYFDEKNKLFTAKGESKKIPKPASLCNFKVTASLLFYHPSYRSVYNILGTDSGKVVMIDLFLNRQESGNSSNIKANPLILIDYHTSCINFLSIFDNRYLITSSEDGVITFTNICNVFISGLIQNLQDDREENLDNYNTQTEESPIFDKTNYYYSKRKSLAGFSKSLKKYNTAFQINCPNKKDEACAGVINLLPANTIKNYFKLKRILQVVQIDPISITYDENYKRKIKTFLSFQLEDNSILFVDMESLKTIYKFNLNSTKHEINAVYHISYEKCFILFLDDHSIRVCNYATKNLDRVITDINRIYSILKVEEKLKMYLLDISDKLIVNNFNTIYDHGKSQQNQTELIISTIQNISSGPDQQITLKLIKDNLSNDKQRALFMEKYIYSIFNKRKLNLNITQNKFESSWVKKVESLIIDEIFKIINEPAMSDKLKQILILNILYNPSLYNKINDRYDNNTYGLESSYFCIGGQKNQYIHLNLEDYLLAIERLVHDGKNKNLNDNINAYNLISLLHIWNLSLDLDEKLMNYFKFSQPIFEINYILQGCDSAMSIILNCEAETDGDFIGHRNFFQEFLKADEEQKKLMKTEKFCNKSYLIKNQIGYLTNFKNYHVSSRLSHNINLTLFGSMIAILGFEEMNDLCRIISSEKSLIRNLTSQNFSLMTCLSCVNKFYFDFVDDITITNKDILLIDHLYLKYHKIKDTNSESKNSKKLGFKAKLNCIISYLDNLYYYLFQSFIFDGVVHFYKMNKEKNIESFKLDLLSEFDLSLINIVVTYNFLVEDKDKIEEEYIKRVSEILILYVFKVLNPKYSHIKASFSKIIVELLSKCSGYLEKIYSENMTNYARFLIELYTMVKIPIDLDGLFKKYEIGNCTIIKSEDNYNFLKILLAKLLKTFSKSSISFILKIIVEEFKKKNNDGYDYFSYLLEILWILFREKNAKYVNYLPPLINVIMTSMSTLNKEMRHVCLDNAKKVLSCLLPNYPMISFHQNSQVFIFSNFTT